MADFTIGSLIEAVHERFLASELSYGHGTDNAWDEAVALVLNQTGAADDRGELERPVPDALVTDIIDIADQRIVRRVPLAYLIGEAHYMGLRFIVEPGVIVPRSPIGYLLEVGLEPWLPKRVERIVDLCCGTGCLGALAALRFPDAQVTLLDKDERAVDLARRNLANLNLDDRCEVHQADVLDTQIPMADLVLANPPYVNARDMADLPPEFRAEPEHGLAAGQEGLAVINPLLERAHEYLRDGGLFVGEVGESAAALTAAWPDLPFIWPDLPRGGVGVFLLEAQALTSHTAAGFA